MAKNTLRSVAILFSVSLTFLAVSVQGATPYDSQVNSASNAANSDVNSAKNSMKDSMSDASGKSNSMAGTMSSDLKGKLKQACQADTDKFCNDITPGSGRIMACLKSHDDKLSSDCQTQWQAARNEWHSKMKSSNS